MNDSFVSDIATHRVKCLVDGARDYLTRSHASLMHVLVLSSHFDGTRTSSEVKLAWNVHFEPLGLRLHHLAWLDYAGQSHCVVLKNRSLGDQRLAIREKDASIAFLGLLMLMVILFALKHTRLVANKLGLSQVH